MKTVSAVVAKAKLSHYFKNDVFTPFFVVIDDTEQYEEFVREFSTLSQVRTSAFCADKDSFPDFDAICNTVRTVSKPTLLLGFGEASLLSGKEESLDRLKDIAISSKVVVLCRSVRNIVKNIAANDQKFGYPEKRRVVFLKSGIPYKVIKISESLEVSAISGFKDLLSQIENGISGDLRIKTSLKLKNIQEVHSAYDAIKYFKPDFRIPSTALSDSLWEEYLKDNELEGYGLDHWRTFLKLKLENVKDTYLKLVIEKSDNYDTYKKRIYCALLDIKNNDRRFVSLYKARKALLKDVKDTEIAEYIAETLIKDNQRIHYLTDTTLAERQEIIQSLNGVENVPKEIEHIYPDLYDYLQPFSFSGKKADLFNTYFSEYKHQKVINKLSPGFHEKVKTLATDGQRPYNSLKTRGEVLDSINKKNSLLFWIDSLGVEYLGFIQNRARDLGLKITVHTVRANLPSITSENRDFYDAWPDKYKIETKELDDVKHNGEKDFNYQMTKTPIHLATELDIVNGVLDWSAQKLKEKSADKVLLVSDHGASRLAVINGQECIWELPTKGIHCGRCCPCSEADVKSEYATSENSFWVLANYDRFKGGRKANVEVHGGATLEEVVIPIIEIELFDSKIEITNTTPEVTASFRKNAEIILFCKNRLKKVSLRILGKQYFAENIGNNKHKIILRDIKKTGQYTADVLESDSLIGEISFTVRRESGKSNDGDWF